MNRIKGFSRLFPNMKRKTSRRQIHHVGRGLVGCTAYLRLQWAHRFDKRLDSDTASITLTNLSQDCLRGLQIQRSACLLLLLAAYRRTERVSSHHNRNVLISNAAITVRRTRMGSKGEKEGGREGANATPFLCSSRGSWRRRHRRRPRRSRMETSI